MSVEFRLLGLVEALRDGRPLVLGPDRPRSVLVALLLDASHPVSLDALMRRIWGTDAPREARNSLHSYLTKLRLGLSDAAEIVRHGAGYVLQTDPDTVDVHRFRSLAEYGRAADQAETALERFDAALRLWRGEPFLGLDSAWLNQQRTALLAEYEAILLDRIDARLELGQHNQLLIELMTRAEREPLNERLAAQLMLAQYRSGRQADAVLAFHRVKTALADELGVDPGATVRALHQSILREDTELDRPHGSAAEQVMAGGVGSQTLSSHERAVVPRQLPSAPSSFVGRQDELVTLTTVLTPTGDGTRLAVIAGSGGMGKTSLALHWAHEHTDLFPDGQLFVNLRGFAPSPERISPYRAMRNFLIAWQVDPLALPEDPDAMTGLYRSVLAAKRVLIVLDNARDADQVEPLLPGCAYCSVMVTSRNKLTSLVISHNATLLPVDSLTEGDALALLTSRLGPRRSAAEPAAVERLAVACAGLPLALTITVGRAQEDPELPLSALAGELGDAGSALNSLDLNGDLSMRAVLSTSYAALTSAEAEVFRLLGLVPGPDVGLPAASALIGQSFAETTALLRELTRASLIQQHSPGRFRMHDLVELYAREQAEQHTTAQDEALWRLTEFYLHTAARAAMLLDPGRPGLGTLPEGGHPLPLHDDEEAWQWLNLEETNLRAALALAHQQHWYQIEWQLTWSMTNVYARSGRYREVAAIWETAQGAAEALGDAGKISLARRFLGGVKSHLGDHQQALENLLANLALADQTGDPVDRILNLFEIARTYERMGRHDLAVQEGERAWQLAQDHSTPVVTLRMGTAMAHWLAIDGQYDRSQQLANTLLDQANETNSTSARAALLDTLGYIHLHTGQTDKAIRYLRDALDLIGSRDMPEHATTLRNLGQAYAERGDVDTARRSLRQALALYEGMHRTKDVRHIITMLDKLDQAE